MAIPAEGIARKAYEKRLSSAEEREAYTLRQRRFEPVSRYQHGLVVQRGESLPRKQEMPGQIRPGPPMHGCRLMAKTMVSKSMDAGSIPATLANRPRSRRVDASGCNPEGSGSSPDVASNTWPIGPVRSGRRIVDAEIAGSNPAWVAKADVVQW